MLVLTFVVVDVPFSVTVLYREAYLYLPLTELLLDSVTFFSVVFVP